LNALVLAHLEQSFLLAALVDEHSAKPVSGRAALFVTELDQPARALKNFRRKLTAVFTRHRAFHSFDATNRF
jgi:hypothetical protein